MKINLHEVKNNEVLLYFCSDVHFGSKFSNVKLFKEKLEEVKKRGGKIIIIGDLFDAIFPLGDKRHNPSLLIPDLAGCDNAPHKAINLMANILLPYIDNILLIGMGNHEETILRFHGYDMVYNLINILSNKTKNKILYGGYSGFLGLLFHLPRKNILNIYYHHGYGGFAPVTEGIMATKRQKMEVSTYTDIMVVGHQHRRWYHENNVIIPLWKTKTLKTQRQILLSLGSYQDRQTIDKSEDPTLPSYAEKKGYSNSGFGGIYTKITNLRERKNKLDYSFFNMEVIL